MNTASGIFLVFVVLQASADENDTEEQSCQKEDHLHPEQDNEFETWANNLSAFANREREIFKMIENKALEFGNKYFLSSAIKKESMFAGLLHGNG